MRLLLSVLPIALAGCLSSDPFRGTAPLRLDPATASIVVGLPGDIPVPRDAMTLALRAEGPGGPVAATATLVPSGGAHVFADADVAPFAAALARVRRMEARDPGATTGSLALTLALCGVAVPDGPVMAAMDLGAGLPRVGLLRDLDLAEARRTAPGGGDCPT